MFLSSDCRFVVVWLPAEPGAQRRIGRVPLRNGSAPSWRVQITRGAVGTFTYRYDLTNASTAKDPIGSISLVIPAGARECEVENPTAVGRRWGGGTSATPIARQWAFPGQPPGVYTGWFHHDQVLRPGQNLDGFGIRSPYRPGLTTAWFGSGEPLEFDQSWPDVVFKESEFVDERRWNGVELITAGPVYPPGAPRETIVAGFRTQLADLVRNGFCDGQSEFVQSLSQALSNTSSFIPEVMNRQRPQTEIEKLLMAAIKANLAADQ